MKLGRKSHALNDVDVTSFGDLAFLLIIFFILTTTFTQPMGEKVTIPSGTSDPDRKKDKEPPTVNVSAEVILFEKEEVTLESLRKTLKDMNLKARKDDDRIIVLESAADVPFQRYYEIMTAISRAGGVLALLEAQDAKEKKGATGNETDSPQG